MDIQTSADRRNRKSADTANLFGWQDWPPAEYPYNPGHKADGPSKDAAIKIAPRARTVRAAVLRHYVGVWPRGLTADQAAADLNFSILTVRPRVSELHRAGMLEPTPDRSKNESGMSAHCWRATADAIAEAAHA